MNPLAKLIPLLFLILCSGCLEQPGVLVRIKNVSAYRFDDISINNVSFGQLDPQITSHYLPFESINENEFIVVRVEDRTFQLLPEHFETQEFYSNGKFKYVLNLTERFGLSSHFIPE